MGMLDGVLSLIPVARVGFIGLYRNEETLEPVEYYVKLPAGRRRPRRAPARPDARDRQLDRRRRARCSRTPARRTSRVIALIAAPEGVAHIEREHPDVRIVVASIDSHLNEKGYIVPGLGDAGDRLYGTK